MDSSNIVVRVSIRFTQTGYALPGNKRLNDFHRVLVTGGSGFIGRYVVTRLQELGHTVLNFDNRPCDPNFPVDTKLGDIEDRAAVIEAFEAFVPDTVIHLAAHASVTASDWDEFSSIWNGTAIVAQAFAGCRNAQRFVNVSTQLVIAAGYRPNGLEDYSPYTQYGEAKAYSEKQLLAEDLEYELVTLRPTNIWGPWHPSYANSVLKYLQKGFYLYPVTNPPTRRTYGYVRNTADQIVKVALHPDNLDKRILYCGDAVLETEIWLDAFSLAFRHKPVRRIPALLLKALGRTGDMAGWIGITAPVDSGRVMRMTTDYPVPLQELHALTGAPEIGLKEGVTETVAWYRQTVTPIKNPPRRPVSR